MTGTATAAALIARGFRVFPIAPGAKAPPLWRDWPARATDNAALFSIEPEACNVGIHCDGLIVVDVDVAKGGFESFTQLDMEYGLPETFTVRTPTGGTHYYFRSVQPVPNSVSVLGPGLDIRSQGGYVVGAGSVVPAGDYRVQADIPIADAPEWLVLKLGTTVPKLSTPAAPVPDAPISLVDRAVAWLRQQSPAVEGQGGDAHTFATAAFLRDYGLSAGQTLTLLLEDWNGRCSPPWSADDLATKVEHAYRYATGEAGAKAVTPDDFPIVNLTPEPKVVKPRTGAVLLSDFAASQTDGPGYLVKGLLTRRSYAELYGPPGAGKTFVAFDLAYHVAAGAAWMDRRVHPGAVLYLAFEGVGGLVKRAQALRQHYGAADVPFYVTAADFNMRDLAGRQALGAVIATLPAKPSLVVIDTFARALMGGDENSAQDVGAFNNAVNGLIESTGACVMILHHTGKDKTRGPRGSSALQGAIDTEIEIDGRVLLPTKQRDIETGQPIGYKLAPIVVGMDDDGDMVTSCVVQPGDAGFKPTVNLTGNAKSGWDVLCQLRPTNEPITTAEWREACAEFLGAKSLNKRFFDIRSRLLSARLITVDADDLITRKME